VMHVVHDAQKVNCLFANVRRLDINHPARDAVDDSSASSSATAQLRDARMAISRQRILSYRMPALSKLG
jgi:hypothetical protein